MKLTLQLRGNLNRHNMHYWENENPRWMRTVPFQNPWSVNCWCGIVGEHVIGPYFFEGRLTGKVYANFLKNVLLKLIEDVPVACSHEHVDATRRCTTPLCTVFKTSDE